MGKREEGDQPGLGDSRLDGLMAEAFGSRRRDGDSVVDFVERSTGVRARVMLRDEPDEHSPLLKVGGSGPDSADDDSRYHMVGEIARGGVGVVYKGRDAELGRDVAIKVLRKDVASHPGIVQRFVEEAQIEGQLQHPGIIPVYGLGLQPDGRPYFAMKLVKGRTLSAQLKERKDPSEDRRRYLGMFEQICQAMAYAHARGVIHRDLKPSNILVGGFGEVLVVDWGFAKVLDRGDESEGPAPLPLTTVVATIRSQEGSSHSLAGSVMGTPAYMPPEQALGHVEMLDERSDVFSLGAVLTEILTGEPPYVGETKDQLVMASQAALDEAHDRLEACGAEEGLVALARHCLSPKSADRPPHAGAVSAELSDWLTETEDRARRAEIEAVKERAALARERQRTIWERRAKRRVLLVAAAMLVAVLAGAASLWWMADRRSARRELASRRVAEAMDRATVHHAAEKWGEAVAEAKGAVELASAEEDHAAATALLATVMEEQAAAVAAAEQTRRDAELLRRLEEIRHSELDARHRILQDAAAKRTRTAVIQAFREWGADLEALTTEKLVEALSRTPLKLTLARRLAGWAGGSLSRDADWAALGTKLIEVADSLDPDPLQMRLRKAHLRKDREGLLSVLREVRLEDLGPYQANHLAAGLESVGEREEAVSLLVHSVELWPDEYWLNMDLGMLLYASDRCEEAIRWVQAAIALRPDSASAWGTLGALNHNCGRLQDALPLFERSLELFGGDPVPHHHYGLTLVKLGHVRKGVEHYDRALAIFPEFAGALWSRGRALLNLDWRRALDDFRRLTEVDDKDARPHNSIGAILLDRMNRPGGALDAFDRAIERDPENWIYHANQARALTALGRNLEAVEARQKDCELRPASGDAHRRLSLALQRVGRNREALEPARKAVELDPFDPWHRRRHSAVLCSLDRDQEALRDARAAVDLAPDFALGLIQLGDVLTRLERCNQAILRYDEALAAIRPGSDLRALAEDSRRRCVAKRDMILRLEEVLKGTGEGCSLDEINAVASLCHSRQRYRAGTYFLLRSIEQQPDPSNAVSPYSVAIISLLAGLGRGVDAAEVADELRRLRDHSRVHLRNLLDQAKAGKEYADYHLAVLREDADFALVREEEHLSKLSEDEGEDWRQTWADIDAFFESRKGGK